MKDGERVIAKSQHSGGGRWMGKVFTEDDSAVAKMEAVKKAEGEVPNEISLCGEGVSESTCFTYGGCEKFRGAR